MPAKQQPNGAFICNDLWVCFSMPLVIVLILLQGTLRDYGTVLTDPLETLLWGILFAAIIIPLTLYNAKSPSNLAVYPQIRSKKWTLSTLLLSGLTWAGYLLFYEFLFRGFLLFACLREFGTVPAVAINMLIYSVAHIPKGKLETIGAIPLGLLLCVVTLATGSIWFAFLAHVIMALSNEWISLYHNKDIKLAIKF
jgi:membrane protease YdiL (CAAX protease family)